MNLFIGVYIFAAIANFTLFATWMYQDVKKYKESKNSVKHSLTIKVLILLIGLVIIPTLNAIFLIAIICFFIFKLVKRKVKIKSNLYDYFVNDKE